MGRFYRYQYLQKILLPYSVEDQVSRSDERYLFDTVLCISNVVKHQDLSVLWKKNDELDF